MDITIDDLKPLAELDGKDVKDLSDEHVKIYLQSIGRPKGGSAATRKSSLRMQIVNMKKHQKSSPGNEENNSTEKEKEGSSTTAETQQVKAKGRHNVEGDNNNNNDNNDNVSINTGKNVYQIESTSSTETEDSTNKVFSNTTTTSSKDTDKNDTKNDTENNSYVDTNPKKGYSLEDTLLEIGKVLKRNSEKLDKFKIGFAFPNPINGGEADAWDDGLETAIDSVSNGHTYNMPLLSSIGGAGICEIKNNDINCVPFWDTITKKTLILQS
jgi:hypothetical protein